MNQCKSRALVLGLSMLFLAPTSQSQVIWHENFDDYEVNSGCIGTDTGYVYAGDYPDSIFMWELVVDTSTFNSVNTHFKIAQIYSDKLLEAKRVGVEVKLITEYINISDYVDVYVNIEVSEVGSHDSGDYIKAYYQLNNDSETLFEINGAINDDFSALRMSQYGLQGDSLRIIIKMLNNATDEKLRVEDILVNGVRGSASLIINEIFNNSDNLETNYIELKNLSNQIIDFSETEYYLSKQQNGVDWHNFKLQGRIPENGLYIIANDSIGFIAQYGYNADFVASDVIDDGNDALCIYSSAGSDTGDIVDVYGMVDTNGEGQEWNYYNTRIQRFEHLNVASTIYDSLEWLAESIHISVPSPGSLENEIRYSSSAWRPNGVAPNAASTTKSITIQEGNAVFDEEVDCSHLSVLTNASISISTSVGVTVSDTLVNKGLIVLNSDDNSCSSLSVGMYSEGSVGYNFKVTDSWHLVSAPVANQNIHDFVTNADNNIAVSLNNNYGVGIYNELNGPWNYYHNGSGTSPNILASTAGSFVEGRAYAILRSSDGYINFNGTLSVSNQSITIDESEWSLLGNPYPAFVNVNNATNTFDNILNESAEAVDDDYEAIYIWDADVGNYRIINQSSSAFYLSPGQGFFVKGDSDGGDYHFTKAMQSHQSGDWFERQISPQTAVIVSLSCSSFKSRTEIKFIEEASSGFDLGYDAAVFPLASEELFISTKLIDGTRDSIDFALQCIEGYDELTNIIPLELWSDEFRYVKLSVASISFPENTSVSIIDQLLGDTIQLDDDGSFYYTWVDEYTYGSQRFLLEVQPNNDLNIDEQSTFRMYYVQAENNLYFNGINTSGAIFTLVDGLGRLVFETQLVNSQSKLTLPKLERSMYIASVVDRNGVYTQKIIP